MTPLTWRLIAMLCPNEALLMYPSNWMDYISYTPEELYFDYLTLVEESGGWPEDELIKT